MYCEKLPEDCLEKLVFSNLIIKNTKPRFWKTIMTDYGVSYKANFKHHVRLRYDRTDVNEERIFKVAVAVLNFWFAMDHLGRSNSDFSWMIKSKEKRRIGDGEQGVKYSI